MVETEAEISKGFGVKVPPVKNILLVGDLGCLEGLPCFFFVGFDENGRFGCCQGYSLRLTGTRGLVGEGGV